MQIITKLRGHPHITSPPWGGGGVCKMMTYDDRGRGVYEMMTSSIKEAFWSSIQKRSLKVLWRSLISFVSMSRVLSISDSNWTWNSLQKEHHIAYVVDLCDLFWILLQKVPLLMTSSFHSPPPSPLSSCVIISKTPHSADVIF